MWPTKTITTVIKWSLGFSTYKTYPLFYPTVVAHPSPRGELLFTRAGVVKIIAYIYLGIICYLCQSQLSMLVLVTLTGDSWTIFKYSILLELETCGITLLYGVFDLSMLSQASVGKVPSVKGALSVNWVNWFF